MHFSEFFPIWSKLTPDQQQRIAQASTFRTVSKGTVLHNGNFDCLGLLLIQSGQLRAYLLSDEGREVTVCRLFERDVCLFSASCVMPDMQFNIVIEAEKDAQFWVIPACLYKELMQESLPISHYTNQLISTHFSDLMWLIEQVMWKSFDKRLAGFLLEEANLEGAVNLKITHEKIANHLGTAREVVTRMLQYFQNEGWVRLTRGSVDITNIARLQTLAD